MQVPTQILLLEDNPSEVERFQQLIPPDQQGHWHIIYGGSLKAAVESPPAAAMDAIVIAWDGLDAKGLEHIGALCQAFSHLPVLVSLDTDNDASGLAAIGQGAQDYWFKQTLTFPQWVRSLQAAMIRMTHHSSGIRSIPAIPNPPSSDLWSNPGEYKMEELENSAACYQAMIETQTEMVVRSLPDTTITFVNESVCQVMHCTPADVIGKKWLMFLMPFSKSQVVQYIAELTPENPSFTLVQQINLEDQSDRWYEWVNTGIFQDGQLTDIVGVGRDVTTRKLAEDALKQRESVHQALIQALPDLIMRMSGDGVYLDFFATDTSLMWGDRDLIGLDIFEGSLSYELALKQLRYIREALQTGELQVYEQEIVVNGDCCTQEVRITVCGDDEVLVLVRDITEYKQISDALYQLNQDLEARVEQRTKALQESEGRFRQIFEQSPMGIAISDLAGRITRVNASLAAMLDISAPDLLNQSIYDLLQSNPQDDIPQLEQILEHTLTVVTFERQPVTQTGKFLWINVISALIFDAFGRPASILHLIKDISDRKQTELENQFLRERLEFVLAASPAVIYTCQLESAYSATFISSNVQNLLGYQPEDFLSSPDFWLEHIHPQDRLQVLDSMPLLLEQGHYTFEYRFRHQQGHYCWLQDEPKLIHDADGTVIEMVGYLADISDRKQTEEKLRQVNERLTLTNAELHRATRLKDEFLANMSHELRTPLNAILGMSEGLLEGVMGDLTERQNRSIAVIERSGKHLLELINDILDLSKIEAGKLELQLAQTPVHRLCENSLSFVKQQAFKKQIQLTIDSPADLPDIVVDERRIRQAVINLLSNAVKFTPDGGQVTLTVQPLQQDDASWLHFSVIDTGIGIDPEDVKRLFTPFAQVDSSLNRQYEGTGLGLALVRRLVELHRGKVGVTSTLGEGSCFTICLPYERSDERSTPSHRAIANSVSLASQTSDALSSNNTEAPALVLDSASTGSGVSTLPKPTTPTVLLAEDNRANIDTLSFYLESRGFRVILARNGREAVNLARQELPDVILMDIQMPEMDGLEATEILRADHQLSRTPIIALTALAMPGDRERCMKAGANDYLTKPIRLKFLVETIQKFLK